MEAATSKSRMRVRGQIYADLKARLPHVKMHTIFDVGANVGQTATRMHEAFPDARIHAFEPVSLSYTALRQHVGNMPNITCHQLALSSTAGEIAIMSSGTSTGNAIVKVTNECIPTERVRTATGDGFCKDQGIGRISFLKVDTEGHDFEVVTGFIGMLEKRVIDVIQVECSMNPRNRKHVPFQRFCDFFESMEMRLFHIYDQVLERERPELRRANPIFVSGT